MYYLISGEYLLGSDQAHNMEELARIVCSGDLDFTKIEIESVPASARDLISMMLMRDPSARFSAQQCLEHKFFDEGEQKLAASSA